MVKESEFVGKNVDLELLSKSIKTFFEADGFQDILMDKDPQGKWYDIQARKRGKLRTLVASRKAIHVVIKGEPNMFDVSYGFGEWGKNIAVAALLGGIPAFVGLGLNAQFRAKVWNHIKMSVDSLTNSATTKSESVKNVNVKYCISCGKQIARESKFCSECGQSQE